MRDAVQHFADDDAFKSAAHGLEWLHNLDFKPEIGEQSRGIGGIPVYLNKLSEPVIGNLHGMVLMRANIR
jgi:hypothetical protein